MIVTRTASLGAVTIALAIGGCAVGPDFDRPPAPTDAGYTPEALATQTAFVRTRGGEAQHFVSERDIPGDWWALFHSEQLNRLIDQALKANPDLDAAQAALRQAQENVYAEQGTLFPQANLNFQAEKERFSGATFGEPSNHAVFGLVTPSVNISYAPDVFGGTRREIESLAAQAEYQRFQLEADLSHADLECRRRCGAGGIAARSDRRDAGHHPGSGAVIEAGAGSLQSRRCIAGRRADPGSAARADPGNIAAAAEAIGADAQPAHRSGRSASRA